MGIGNEGRIQKEEEMKNRRRKIMTAVVVTAGILLMAGCGVKDTAAQEASAEKPVDAVSSASQVFYKDSSLDREQLWAVSYTHLYRELAKL